MTRLRFFLRPLCWMVGHKPIITTAYWSTTSPLGDVERNPLDVFWSPCGRCGGRIRL
jgi:hypothetical protein